MSRVGHIYEIKAVLYARIGFFLSGYFMVKRRSHTFGGQIRHLAECTVPWFFFLGIFTLRYFDRCTLFLLLFGTLFRGLYIYLTLSSFL